MEANRSLLPEGHSFRIGDVLFGNYQLEVELHRGPRTVIYRALDLAAKQPVAVKVLHRPSHREHELAPFLRAAYHLTLFNHPNVIKIRQLGWLAAGSAYYVMELLGEGETFLDWIDTMGNPTLACRIKRNGILAQIQDVEALLEPHGIVSWVCPPRDLFLVNDPSAPGGVRPKFLYLGRAPHLPSELLNAPHAGGTSPDEFAFEMIRA